MASLDVSNVPASTAEDEMNEAKLNSSLNRLHELHAQLRRLRNTMPKLLQPFLVEHTSPEDLYARFSNGASAVTQDIREFAKTMEVDQPILDQVKESRMANKEGIMGWMVTQHKDWLDMPVPDNEAGMVDEMEREADTIPTDAKLSDIRVILERFKEAHAGIQVSIDEGLGTGEVYLPPPARIHFRIESKNSLPDQTTYNISCKEVTQLHSAIARSINRISKPTSLASLLELLASYTDVKSKTCFKCTRLLDTNAQFPIVRTRVGKKTPNSDSRSEWRALHEGCA